MGTGLSVFGKVVVFPKNTFKKNYLQFD